MTEPLHRVFRVRFGGQVREVETDAQGGGERRRGRPRKATAVATEYRGTSDPTSSQSRAARWRSKSPSPSPGLQQPPQRSRTIESLINSMKARVSPEVMMEVARGVI